MRKRQVILEDGRYLIYYTFEDELPPPTPEAEAERREPDAEAEAEEERRV